jgi:hypothetical protein
MHKNIVRIIFAVIALLSISIPLSAETPFDVRLHLEITGMEQPKPPFVLNRNLILSYKADHPVRFVGAAFAHEDYKTLHTFEKNDFDVYILAYPLSSERKQVKYRMVVDGLWMIDPHNSNVIVDGRNISISVFDVPELPKKPITGPEVAPPGHVTFYFRGRENATAYLTGSFNNWDPFMYEMREVRAGLYTLTIKLNPGTHYYYFLINGQKLLDPFNPTRGLIQGSLTSRFSF